MDWWRQIQAQQESQRRAIEEAIASVTRQQQAAKAAKAAQDEVDRYTASFNALQIQENQIQQTLDLTTSARGLYSGISDDLHSSVSQFDSQIKDLQNQINITNRREPEPTWWPWLNAFLNVMLVFVLIYAIYIVVYKFTFVRPVVQQTTYQY